MKIATTRVTESDFNDGRPYCDVFLKWPGQDEVWLAVYDAASATLDLQGSHAVPTYTMMDALGKCAVESARWAADTDAWEDRRRCSKV